MQPLERWLRTRILWFWPCRSGPWQCRKNVKPEPIGADTISSNPRRILRYTRPVELNETSLKELAKKIQSQHEAQKTAAPAKAEEAGADEE